MNLFYNIFLSPMNEHFERLDQCPVFEKVTEALAKFRSPNLDRLYFYKIRSSDVVTIFSVLLLQGQATTYVCIRDLELECSRIENRKQNGH